MKFGIVVFPGTWSEKDTQYAVSDVLGYESDYIWHDDDNLDQYDVIVLPGGFSYGDFLRCGAIARFSPVMEAVRIFADKGVRSLEYAMGSKFFANRICYPVC